MHAHTFSIRLANDLENVCALSERLYFNQKPDWIGLLENVFALSECFYSYQNPDWIGCFDYILRMKESDTKNVRVTYI